MSIVPILYAILLAMLTTCFFTHSQYKKNNHVQKIMDILTFKKMIFNKTIYNISPKVVKINFILFMSFTIFWGQDGFWPLYEPMSITHYFGMLLRSIIFWSISVFILRLIFELIVIPLCTENNNATSQNIYLQNFPAQYQTTNFSNMQPSQQNMCNLTQTQNIVTDNSTNPLHSETEYTFCSQCGTRYNITDGKCPNCGMQ